MSKSISQKSLSEALLKASRLKVKSPLRKFSRFFNRTLTNFGLSHASNNALRTVKAAKAAKASAPALPPVLFGKPAAGQTPAMGPLLVKPANALPRPETAAARPDAPRPHWTDPLVDTITAPSPQGIGGAGGGPDTPTPIEAVEAKPGIFSEGVFGFDGQSYQFRLYVPATLASHPRKGGRRAQAKPSKARQLPGSLTALVTAVAAKAAPLEPAALPLIVLLHGCQQNAVDFAQGTAMNELADANQCMVLYPEQLRGANSGRCWNWFEPAHQQRDCGEPGMIAALTRQLLGAEHAGRRADPQRVYIAGLSAGGAMSAVVADLYPDIFAAVGVHSGLPAGAANGMMAAFGAMSRGAKGQRASPLPTIVFHGTADRTVHPDNGANVREAALTALRASGLALVKSSSKPSRSRAEPLSASTAKTIYRAANGPSYIEHWKVEEGPHAWSGGNAEGSYTAPDGPSASAAMLAFFLQHKRPPTPPGS
jgi:poly(hydroxyalkanoate) depolymerase family esterase